MKKIGFLLLTLIFSPLSYALDAKGTIDEIKICGTGHTKTPRWIRTLQFKIDNTELKRYLKIIITIKFNLPFQVEFSNLAM